MLVDTATYGTEASVPILVFDHFDSKSTSYAFETNTVAAISTRRKIFVRNLDLDRTVTIPAPFFYMQFTSVAVHPTDKSVIAAGSSDGRIYLWAKLFSSNSVIPSFYLHWHSNPLRSLSFSPEGTFIFSAGEEAVLVKWLWRKQQRSFVPRVGAPVSSLSLSHDGAMYALGLVDSS